MIRIIQGDMLVELPKLIAAGERFHACVCDPPYHLTSIVKRFGKENAAPAQYGKDGAFARASRGFMGKQWDGGDIAFRPETWRLVYDALLPGAHMLCFGGTRTFHRMACAIEDAGFEFRDTLCWLYGSGFPKSHNVSKAIDKAAGAEREILGPGQRHNSKRCSVAHGDSERLAGGVPPITAAATLEAAAWEGWGTALQPAFEPIVLFRKPLAEHTVADNVLRHGTGALNIDASMVPTNGVRPAVVTKLGGPSTAGTHCYGAGISRDSRAEGKTSLPRWPANVLHDGSDEVVAAFPDAPGAQAPLTGQEPTANGFSGSVYGNGNGLNRTGCYEPRGDSGSAARFFYSAKADGADRAGSKHPTVKPTDLIRYLVRLITPPGGTVLDCFAGTGTTGLAADQLGFDAVLIEQDAQYAADARRKIASDAPLFVQVVAEGADERLRKECELPFPEPKGAAGRP